MGSPEPTDRDWPWLLTLFCVVVIIFFPVLAGEFTNWDDNVNVTENPFVNPPTAAGLARLWERPFHNLYVPLVYTSYAIDMALGRGAAWTFHLTNLLLHAATVCLMFVVLRVLTTRESVEPRSGKEQQSAAARGADDARHSILIACFLPALLFAVHPLQVEPVAWITGRKDVLSGFFAVLAVLMYLLLKTSFDARWMAATACFACSLLSKPAAVTLPFAIAAIDLAWRKNQVRRVAVALAPWMAISMVWVVVTSLAQQVPAMVYRDIAWWQRPFIAGDAFLFYMRKLFMPVGLAPVYGRTPQWLMAQPSWWLGGVSSAAIIAGTTALAARGRREAAGLLVFITMLLPTLGLVPFMYQDFSTVADRYAYLALPGAALVMTAFLQRWPFPIYQSAGACAVALLAVLTFRQTSVWKNSESVWRRAVDVAPHIAQTHNNLGDTYAKQKRGDLATYEFEQAVKADPNFGEAHNNMGLQAIKNNNNAAAVGHFERAIAAHRKMGFTDRRLYEAMVNCSAALLALQRYSDAERLLREAIMLDKLDYAAYANLGRALTGMNRRDEAVQMLKRALELNPADAATAAELRRISG